MFERDRGEGALLLLAALILAAVAVPYTLLRGVESFVGAFLFWTVFGVAAVGIILYVLRGWQP